MLDDAELKSLADDIRANGLQQSIVTFEDKILDGRNRFNACQLAGVEPRFVPFNGSRLDAVKHVWSLNRVRRHLTSSQAAMAEVRRAQLCEEYAAEIQRLRETQPKGGRPTADKPPQLFGEVLDPHDRELAAQRAQAAGTNRQYITDAEKIAATSPELAEQVIAGEKSIPQAKRELASASPQAQLKQPVHALVRNSTLKQLGRQIELLRRLVDGNPIDTDMLRSGVVDLYSLFGRLQK